MKALSASVILNGEVLTESLEKDTERSSESFRVDVCAIATHIESVEAIINKIIFFIIFIFLLNSPFHLSLLLNWCK